jgi:hypothetical protein
MPASQLAFVPSTQTLLITGTSVASAPLSPSSGGGFQAMQIVNLSTDTAWTAIGKTTATAALPTTSAASGSFPILPRTRVVLSTPPGAFVSCMTSAAAITCTLALTPGVGL